ncbi:MAG: hypothetical protein Q4C33_01290 [bacterium]|nr:hypothetical protein [bacterium]
MKKCINCKNNIKEKDIYCRNCGCRLYSSFHYIFMDIAITIVVIGLIGVIALLVASYLLF